VDPKLIGHDMAYPAMLRFLPAGFLGLMVAGLLAAYVSTNPTGDAALRSTFPRPLAIFSPPGEAIRGRAPVVLTDVDTDGWVPDDIRELIRKRGDRSGLWVRTAAYRIQLHDHSREDRRNPPDNADACGRGCRPGAHRRRARG